MKRRRGHHGKPAMQLLAHMDSKVEQMTARRRSIAEQIDDAKDGLKAIDAALVALKRDD